MGSCCTFPCNFDIVKGQDAAHYDLSLFMPLARDQDDVVRLRMFNGKGNRVTPVANFMRALGTGHHISPDKRRIFASWIVAGHNYAIAFVCCNRCHNWTLSAIAIAADQQGFERVTFAVLHLEARVKGPDPSQAITQYQQIVAADRTYFKAKEPLVMALLGIAHHARLKKDPKSAKIDRDTGNRYLEEFLKAKDLGPEAYRSVGRHLRAIRAGEPAVRILEAGAAKHPRHSQLRADYVSARILAGQTEAYGTRRSVADELETLLTLRRPSPLIWQEAASWLRTESKLPPERLRKLEAACAALVRSNLDPEALAGF
jgi:hypothetical protein